MQGTTGRVIVGLLWLTILVIVAGAWGAGARAAKPANTPKAQQQRPVEQPIHPSANVADDADPAEPQHEDTSEAEPDVDLFGNEIERAVSDYRVDFDGDLYESHSPDTAITHLTAPSL